MDQFPNKLKQIMKKNLITFIAILIFGLGLIIFLGTLMGRNSNNKIKSISSNELVKLTKSKDIQLIDVRKIEEYESGHIEGSLNLDFFQRSFIANLDSLDKSKITVVYCKSGNRSLKSAHILKSLGFKDIFELSEGVNGWVENRNSIVILDTIN